MRVLALLSVSALVVSACTVADDFEGSVYQFNGETVTIRGAYSMDGSTARPTSAMIRQAKDVCPGAEYLSATPSPTDEYTFLYLFKC
jgi:hypothetical protein